MCSEQLTPGPCWNFKCPHNLFWEELKLRSHKITPYYKESPRGKGLLLFNQRAVDRRGN